MSSSTAFAKLVSLPEKCLALSMAQQFADRKLPFGMSCSFIHIIKAISLYKSCRNIVSVAKNLKEVEKLGKQRVNIIIFKAHRKGKRLSKKIP